MKGQFDYVEASQYRRRLLEDYFWEHGGDMDIAISEYRADHYCTRLQAIVALYWRMAFGVAALECPNCEHLTINAWNAVDVWNCFPCCKADVEWEAMAEAMWEDD